MAEKQRESPERGMLVTVGGWAAASIGYALIVDMAIETYSSGSPFRWWVVLAVVLFTVLIALYLGVPGRRRGFPAWTCASVSVLLFLALLAVSSVWPRWQLHVLGFEQPSLSYLVLSIALLTSMVPIVLQRGLHPVIRGILSLLTGYAIAAWLWAHVNKVSPEALFRGEGFWSAVPTWGQGAVIGGLLLLPLSIVYMLLWSIVSARRRARGIHLTLTSGLAILLTIPLNQFLGEEPGNRRVAEAKQVPPTAERSRTSESGRAVPSGWQAMRSDLRSRIDWTRLGIDALQEHLGSSPDDLFTFVRDEIGLEPYKGALRGARGALLARSGNSVDRSLLLQALLGTAGYDTRLVEGRLAQRQRASLLRRVLAEGPTVENLDPVLEPVAGVAASELEGIGDALWKHGFRAAPATDPLRTAREALTRHVWVQARVDGHWTNLDPVPGAEPGDSLTSGQHTHAGIPDDWHHDLQIRLAVDVEYDTKVRSREILNHESRYADLAAVPVGIVHERQAENGSALLVIGDRVVRSKPYPFPQAEESGAHAPSEEMIDMLGGLPTGAGDEETQQAESKKAVELVRLRLELGLRGPALDEVESFTVTLADRNEAESVEQFRSAIDGITGIGTSGGSVVPDFAAAMLVETSNPLVPAGIVRQLAALEAARAGLRARVPVSVFGLPTHRVVNGPQLTVLRVRSAEAAGSVRLDVNLVRKAYDLFPVGDSVNRGNTLFYDYVFNGSLDHAVERTLLRGGFGSVGALTDAAIEQDIGLTIASSSDEVPGYLSANLRSAARTAFSRGRTIVLPEAVPDGVASEAIGWWEIENGTGWTEDRRADGGHQEQAEYGILTARRASESTKWRQFGCVVGVVLSSTTGQIGEAMTATGDPAGVIISTASQAAEEAFRTAGCRGTSVPAAHSRLRRVGSPTPSSGLHRIERTIPRKPYIQGGRYWKL